MRQIRPTQLRWRSYNNNNTKNMAAQSSCRILHVPEFQPSSLSSMIPVRSFGGYSRMLDLGGAPSSSTTSKKSLRMADASKNSQIQAVCFDFDILTQAFDNGSHRDGDDHATMGDGNSKADGQRLDKVQPDVGAIEQMASLLNIDLGGSTQPNKPKEADDLSLLTGEHNGSMHPTRDTGSNAPSSMASTTTPAPVTGVDIRAKYADKLHKRGVEGGLASVALAKSKVDEALRKGDAAGHLHARQVAVKAGNSGNNSQRWMANTGTGRLLQYLTRRSIKIAILPTKAAALERGVVSRDQATQMQDFAKQLRNVIFDVLVPPAKNDEAADQLVRTALCDLEYDSDATAVLLVSDRDDYLRAGKEAGLAVCRVRPPNARRGNVSTHYTVAAVPGVEEIINEANGISFNAVVNR